jgi:hypothetical protein
MPFRLEDCVRILRSTPRTFAALFEGLAPEWISARAAPDAFSAIDVLGPLIYGERTDWIPRARIILEYGESRPFDPFDRRGFLPLLEGRSSADLLKMFAEAREQSLRDLENLHLGPAELELAGTHPALGRVTLRNLLSAWAVHDLGHIGQAARALASQYRGEVGPWTAFMSVLDVPKP